MRKIFIGFILILSGCSSALKIEESFKAENFDFSLLSKSKITFVGTEKIYLREFKKTFKDEYSDTSKLNLKLFETFSEELKKKNSKSMITYYDKKIPKVFLGDLSFKEFDKIEIDSFFKELNSDILLLVNNIEISNKYEPTQNFNSTNNTMTSSSSEDCVVTIEFECWDVKNQKRILSYKSHGKDTVFLILYLNALNNAIEEAINNSVEYILNNGVIK
jgi:hypothetical protein